MSQPVPEYLIDKILPSQEIHLLGGPSGAGKTRFLFHTLLQWQAGLPILGYKSRPVPWVYVASDRSEQSVYRTLDDLGIEHTRIPIIPAWDEQLTLNQILGEAGERQAKLVVIEGFGGFVEPPAVNHQVRSYLSAAQRAARSDSMTIIGVMESPKMKPRDKYENPRQRISGVASWAHYSDTIFLVEPSDAKDPSNRARVLHCCPRNAPSLVLDAEITLPHGEFRIIKPATFEETIRL